ncbi:MAG: ribosome maturation factor RimP [Campylobacterota bacterium]|nr:ribosome maturation factor RimP [Campylobacterota bacterium]
MELEEAIKLAVEGCGVELYDISATKEHKKNILRIYITSKDGVTLEKCTQVSRMISPLLDIHEPFSGEYNLEVSSPGIERKLKTLPHFKASIGENIKIKTYDKEILKGKVESVSDDGTIILKDDQGEENISKYDDIQSASTYYNWNK